MEKMKSGDQVNQVTLAYNGDVVIKGTVAGQTTEWRITQAQIIGILKFINLMKE
jgi:hypothetical protein